VSLTEEGEIDVRVENSSRVRTWVTAKMNYKVGGLNEHPELEEPSKDRLDKGWKTFLDQGGWNGEGGKRPDNDDRKKDKGPQS